MCSFLKFEHVRGNVIPNTSMKLNENPLKIEVTRVLTKVEHTYIRPKQLHIRQFTVK